MSLTLKALPSLARCQRLQFPQPIFSAVALALLILAPGCATDEPPQPPPAKIETREAEDPSAAFRVFQERLANSPTLRADICSALLANSNKYRVSS